MKLNFQGVKNASTPTPSGNSLAETFAKSREAYAGMYAPIKLHEAYTKFCNKPKIDDPIEMLSIYWREYSERHKGTQVIEQMLSHVTVRMNDKYAKDTWAYIPETSTVELSTFLWEAKDYEASEYAFFAALAQCIQNQWYQIIDKRFYWQLIFYCMGFNPRKELEATKAIEADIAEVFTNGKS